MEKKCILLLFFFLFLLKSIADAKVDCWPASCGPYEPVVRFPFRILGQQLDKCGYPGFDLSCNEQNQTTIQLPSSLPYIVKSISYDSQVIYIDPELCRPNRIVSLKVTATPFDYSNEWMRSYTFYNCSQNYSFLYPIIPFPCLSSGNHWVFAVLLTDSFDPGYMPSNCTVMKTIMVPVQSDGDIREALELTWLTPYCRSCEREGEVCKLNGDDGRTICVSTPSRQKGISMGVNYGLSIVIAVPALICFVWFIRYASSKVQGSNDSHNQGVELSSAAIIPQSTFITGLDGPTINSYPKNVLGNNYSLPNDDIYCAICLCDYKCKDSLRTIPECNHYFHAKCIDEWLNLNAICPVCRNTLESSILITSCTL